MKSKIIEILRKSLDWAKFAFTSSDPLGVFNCMYVSAQSNILLISFELVFEALLNEEDYSKANALAKKMQGLYTESYLPLGDGIIRHDFQGRTPSAYIRELDLQRAISTTRFTIDGILYQREVFTSAPGNIMLVRITANHKGAYRCFPGRC